jgi:hydrogenase expression/formation protein HypD
MKFVDEFRNPEQSLALLHRIKATVTRPWVLMEVCGGQTHGLLRCGIDVELSGVVELIHGPGCPVCVTDMAAIDHALDLAHRPHVLLASFGDMLRVPGSRGSLLTARANGANVLMVYSPLDAVRYAESHPSEHVVFFAVGFETTAPATALAVLQAQRLGLDNFSVLASHVRVLPAMEALIQAPQNRVQGFLAAGHVCCITGYSDYEEFVRRFQVPVVVTGFETIDLLQGILDCVMQLESGSAEVHNSYSRSVDRSGNRHARDVIAKVYEIDTRVWRGLGPVDSGGYSIRRELQQFDAMHRFNLKAVAQNEINPDIALQARCRAGEVLTGRLKPCDCAEFRKACTPETPLGAPMVSSEGACAAYEKFHPRATL